MWAEPNVKLRSKIKLLKLYEDLSRTRVCYSLIGRPQQLILRETSLTGAAILQTRLNLRGLLYLVTIAIV